MEKTLLFILFFVFAIKVSAQKHHLNTKNGLALHGYDAVSYFKGKAMQGKKEFSFTFNGAIYNFQNKANLELFKADPEKYEPQYGGWCAYAMGLSGEKVEINPETFKILNGKLYLFYNAYLNNTLTKWNKDEKNLLLKAESNWKNY